jgi:hypothetical protein
VCRNLEIRQRAVKSGEAEIGLRLDRCKSSIIEKLRHRRCVIDRIYEMAHVNIGSIAYDERHATSGLFRLPVFGLDGCERESEQPQQ